jgi:Predicted membrane protein (DUF2079)
MHTHAADLWRRRLTENYGWIGALALSLAFFGFNLWLQVAKWQSFHYASFDYANVVSILEESWHLRFQYLDPTHVYGAALSQVYLIYLAAFRLVPSPYTLMVLVAAFFSTTIFATYIAARTVFDRPLWPLILAWVVAVNPFFIVASLAGFRQNMPILAAMPFAFWAYQRKRPRLFVAAILVAAASQANIIPGLILLGAGLLRWGDRRFAKLLLLAAGAWLLVNVAIVLGVVFGLGIPPPAKLTHLNSFGEGIGGFLGTLTRDPGAIWTDLVVGDNLTLLLLPLSFLLVPLLAPLWLVAAAPEFIYMALSTHGLTALDERTRWAVDLPHPWFSFFNTGMVLALPFLILGLINGSVRLRDAWLRRRPPSRRAEAAAAALVLVASFVFLRYLTPTAYGPFPLVRGADFSEVAVTEHDRVVSHTIRQMPPNLSYMMQYGFYFYSTRTPRRLLLNEDNYRWHEFDKILYDTNGECPTIGRAACEALWKRLPNDERYIETYARDGVHVLTHRSQVGAAP